jgi:hypothetical protein
MVVTIEIIKEAPSADQKSSTSSALLHLAVSINIEALITKENNPRESSIAGRVSNLTIDPITPLIRPNNKATHRYVQAPPLTVKPVIKVVAAQKASAPAIRRTIRFTN